MDRDGQTDTHTHTHTHSHTYTHKLSKQNASEEEAVWQRPLLAPSLGCSAFVFPSRGTAASHPSRSYITCCLQLFSFYANFSALYRNDSICYGKVLLLFCFYETWSCYTVQAILKLNVLLSLPPANTCASSQRTSERLLFHLILGRPGTALFMLKRGLSIEAHGTTGLPLALSLPVRPLSSDTRLGPWQEALHQ